MSYTPYHSHQSVFRSFFHILFIHSRTIYYDFISKKLFSINQRHFLFLNTQYVDSSVVAHGQQLDWLTLFDERSATTSVEYCDDGDFLISGYSSSSSSFIARIDGNGEILWINEVPSNSYRDARKFVFLNENKTIILYSLEGTILTLDSLGQQLIDSSRIEPAGFEIFEATSFKRMGDMVLVYGLALKNQKYGNFYLIYDPETDEISLERFVERSSTYNFHVSMDSEENFVFVRTEGDTLFIVHYNAADSISRAVHYPHSNIYVEDLILDNDSRIYINGYIIDTMTTPYVQTGYVGCYSANDGSNLWHSYFPPDPGYNYSSIEKIVVLPNNNLFCAGQKGLLAIGPITDLQYALLDGDGRRRWMEEKHIHGEGDFLTSVHSVDNESVVMSGTSGVSDTPHNMRSFIMQIGDLFSGRTELQTTFNNLIYPNPVDAYLNISLPQTLSDADYQIVNMKGDILSNGNTGDHRINVSFLPTGTYIIRIKNAQENVALKFVKK